MFDLNAIVNAAITEAVNARITEVLAQHANIVGALAERVETLEKNEEALVRRIAALENNPAQGVDTSATPATITADAFVTHLDKQEWFWSKMSDFIERGVDGHGLVSEARVEEMVQEAMDDHTSTYDHDEYDNATSVINDTDFDDFMTKSDDLEDAIRDTVRGMSFEIR